MRFSRPGKRGGEVGVLPLVNIVFLLLIFFMLAGRLEDADPFPLEPVRSASRDAPAPREHLLLLGRDGALALDGVRLDKAGLIDALGGDAGNGPQTPARAARTAASETGTAEPRRLWLKVDEGAEALDLVSLLDLLAELRVSRIELVTTPLVGD